MKDVVLGNERTKGAYERLVQQFEAVHGSVSAAADALLLKAAYLEGLHQEAVQDLEKDGLREKYPVSNYRSGERENKALGQMLKIQAAQTKLLRELKLLPDSRKAQQDEADEAGDISDY